MSPLRFLVPLKEIFSVFTHFIYCETNIKAKLNVQYIKTIPLVLTSPFASVPPQATLSLDTLLFTIHISKRGTR